MVWSFPNAQPQRSLIHTLVSRVVSCHVATVFAGRGIEEEPCASYIFCQCDRIGQSRVYARAWHEALHPSLIDQEFAIDRHFHGVDQIVGLRGHANDGEQVHMLRLRHSLLFCRRSVRVDA